MVIKPLVSVLKLRKVVMSHVYNIKKYRYQAIKQKEQLKLKIQKTRLQYEIRRHNHRTTSFSAPHAAPVNTI